MIEWRSPVTSWPKNSRLTSLGPADTQWGMSNFCCGRDRGHGTMRKAMIIAAVLIKLLWVVRALFTCRGFPGRLRGENCPGAGLSGPGNRLCGVSTPVRLAAWPAPPWIMYFVQGSAVIPSRAITLSDPAAWSGLVPTYHTPGNADGWPGSRLSMSPPVTHHSPSTCRQKALEKPALSRPVWAIHTGGGTR